jgi:hypothetical protein
VWAQVSDDLWVASLGAVHLGRVETTGARYRAVDHLNQTIGTYTDPLRARQSVSDRSDEAVRWQASEDALQVRPTTGVSRTYRLTALITSILLVSAGATVAVVLITTR